jgi:hypothetical protein
MAYETLPAGERTKTYYYCDCPAHFGQKQRVVPTNHAMFNKDINYANQGIITEAFCIRANCAARMAGKEEPYPAND